MKELKITTNYSNQTYPIPHTPYLINSMNKTFFRTQISHGCIEQKTSLQHSNYFALSRYSQTDKSSPHTLPNNSFKVHFGITFPLKNMYSKLAFISGYLTKNILWIFNICRRVFLIPGSSHCSRIYHLNFSSDL